MLHGSTGDSRSCKAQGLTVRLHSCPSGRGWAGPVSRPPEPQLRVTCSQALACSSRPLPKALHDRSHCGRRHVDRTTTLSEAEAADTDRGGGARAERRGAPAEALTPPPSGPGPGRPRPGFAQAPPRPRPLCGLS